MAVLMVFATLIPGLGVRVGGARRWLNVLGIQFQPLEILTLGVPMFLADRLSSSRHEDFQCFCKPTLSIAVLSAIPLVFQPNMGGTILVFAICMSMHVVNRGWKYPLIGGLFLFFVFIVMIYAEGYRMRRLLAFLNPWDDPMNKGFQIIQGLVAFSNGGILGVGVGKGLQKLNYLPAAHTDYIFPAIGEEFGLIGTLFIVLLYAFWTFKAYSLFRRSGDPYISVLVWGITASILFPMFVNLGGVMKLMPLTGVPLPFVSFGGTALVIMWVKVGILMRVAKEVTLYSAKPLSRNTSGMVRIKAGARH
jgi:cell division protein FtsW